MHLYNADVLRYIFEDMLWSCVLELMIYTPLSTFRFLTSPFRCIFFSVKHRSMVFWRAPSWKAKGMLIVDFVIVNSQLTQRWTSFCCEAIHTAIGSAVGVVAVLTANIVTPSFASVWPAICPAPPRNHIACWIHQSWQLAASAVLSAKRWAVVKVTAAKRLIATSNVKLSHMAKSLQVQQTAATDGLSSQADMSAVMLLKGAQHSDVDKQPHLLKAHRAGPSKPVSKEPSAKPGRAGAKGRKASAGPKRAQPGAPAKKPSQVAVQAHAGIESNHALAVLHQAEAGAETSTVIDQAQPEAVGNKRPALLDRAQAGANANTHLRLPDQAHSDSTWPVRNKRARKQLRKASQAAAADETPHDRDDEPEADAAADLFDIPEGEAIKPETSVAVCPSHEECQVRHSSYTVRLQLLFLSQCG